MAAFVLFVSLVPLVTMRRFKLGSDVLKQPNGLAAWGCLTEQPANPMATEDR